MAGASFKFLQIFASYRTDSENWVSYLDDWFFYEPFFGKFWATAAEPRKPMLALSNLLSNDFILSLFPELFQNTWIDVQELSKTRPSPKLHDNMKAWTDLLNNRTRR